MGYLRYLLDNNRWHVCYEEMLKRKINADICSLYLKILWAWGISVKFISISKMSAYGASKLPSAR